MMPGDLDKVDRRRRNVDNITMNSDTFTESPDITTTPIDKLLPLDPGIMKKWEGFRGFADKKGCHYPDYFVILLWEEYKNVCSLL